MKTFYRNANMKSHFSILLLAILASFVSWNAAWGQTATEEKPAVSGERFNLETNDFNPEAPVAKNLATKKPRPMLPRYFSQVVSTEQRAEIRDIQEQYLPLIKMLEARIEALREEMNHKVHAVLSEEQAKEVAKAHEEARKKRQATSTARNATPAPVPAPSEEP